MNRLFVFLFLLLTLHVPSQAILFYHDDGTPVRAEELRDGQKVHPDVCRIEYKADESKADDFSTYGSGVFLSPNVVLTARHVVCHAEPLDDKGLSIRTPSFLDMICKLSQFTVLIQNTSLKVKRVELFEDGHEDFALLILETSINHLDKFRQVRATCIDEAIPSVSVMGYGVGRIISQSERVLAELDDAHLETPQLRFRHDMKPIEAGDFKIEGHFYISLYDGISKTFKKDREYPTFSVTSKHVRMMTGDSGAPILDDNGLIFGVMAEGNAKFVDDEKAIMDRYEKVILAVPMAYEAITKSLTIGGGLCVAAANYFCGPLPLLNTVTAIISTQTFFVEESPLTNLVKPWLEKRIKRTKNYDKYWGERNAEIRKSLTVDKRNFASRYTCFRQDVVEWINKMIEANKTAP